MQKLEALPIFPLNTVLFPYAQILVHIFEDRYRLMINECLREGKPFGIALIKEGSEVGETAEPHLIGTLVKIVSNEPLDGGAMNILVQGEGRFRIRRLDHTMPYLVGHVEYMSEAEVEDTPRNMALAMRAREDFQKWVYLQVSRNGFGVQVRFPEDMTALSFAIANFLPIENLIKQRLLEMTDTSQRIADLLPMLENQIAEFAEEPGFVRLTSNDFSQVTLNN